MSQDLQNDKFNNQQKKKTRRTRKDQEGRNFSCPCGKSYLSYPALYTHVKTKHQGKTPKQNPQTNSKLQVQEELQTKQPLLQIKQIVDKYFPGDDISVYPTPLDRQDSQYLKTILENWDSVKSSKLEDTTNSTSESINNIFARFLSEMKPQVKSQGYLYLCQLICCFYRTIILQKKQKDFCKENNGYQLPTFFNEFILKKKADGYIKRGSPTDNLLLACKILYSFGIWMFQQRYTNFSVKYNSYSN